MATYRIYHVGQGGRLRLGESLQARNDEEAAAVARNLLAPGHAAELWEGGRIVGRFSAARDFEPGAG